MPRSKREPRERLEIAADIYDVFEKKLPKKKQDALLKPLFEEMKECEQRNAEAFEREKEQAYKKWVAEGMNCSPYEIGHGRGCGHCSACLAYKATPAI